MDSKRLFSSRQSLPLLGGAVLLALLALALVRSGGKAVEHVTSNAGAGAPGGEPRELVTIKINTRYKLKRASWGPIEVPSKPPPPDPEEEEPRAERYQGLDVAVTGR